MRLSVCPSTHAHAHARTSALLALIIGLAGCGQKGPLRLAEPIPAAAAASNPSR
ncbi:MAG: lipoprotein [Paucibacter sp.]|nr:lipoprotein [Roseateles sp.]